MVKLLCIANIIKLEKLGFQEIRRHA